MSICEAHTELRPLSMCTCEAHILESLHVKDTHSWSIAISNLDCITALMKSSTH